MARIKMITWNIQVLGPKKHKVKRNSTALCRFISAVVESAGANILVLQELMNSISGSAARILIGELKVKTSREWNYFSYAARPNNDREAYGIFWQEDASFTPITDAAGARQEGLASNRFPVWYSNDSPNGRRAAYVAFRTTDTNNNFVVSTYHSPPTNPAAGVLANSRMPEIYTVDNNGTREEFHTRLLAGDFNMDINHDAHAYRPFTDLLPAVPPPANAGEGTGTEAAINDPDLVGTLLGNYKEAVKRWGDKISDWADDPLEYRQKVNLIDNIFHTPSPPPHNTESEVLDIIDDIVNKRNLLFYYANKFPLLDRKGRKWMEAFPHARLLLKMKRRWSGITACVFLFYRYAISDHLPVKLSIDI